MANSASFLTIRWKIVKTTLEIPLKVILKCIVSIKYYANIKEKHNRYDKYLHWLENKAVFSMKIVDSTIHRCHHT